MNEQPPSIANVLLAGLITVGVLALLFLAVKASAHDRERPDLDSWFMGLESKGHSPCCDGSEALRLDDVDWESHDDHYRVRLPAMQDAPSSSEQVWVDVPDEAVVEGPNRDGRAMVWPHYIDGHPVPRCFMPGAEG